MSKSIPKAIKAYNDFEFLNSPDARVIRMLAEFLGPQRRFRQEHVRDTIVFFGSARIKPRSETTARVREVRKLLKGVNRFSRGQLKLLRSAELQLEMSRYYEDTVELARLSVPVHVDESV